MLRNKVFQHMGKFVGLFALAIAVVQANVACPYLSYQPELPDAVKKLRKFEE